MAKLSKQVAENVTITGQSEYITPLSAVVHEGNHPIGVSLVVDSLDTDVSFKLLADFKNDGTYSEITVPDPDEAPDTIGKVIPSGTATYNCVLSECPNNCRVKLKFDFSGATGTLVKAVILA